MTTHAYTNPAFNYDANSNMTAGMGRSNSYTSYNMPAHFTGVGYSGGSGTTDNYVHNAAHERTKLVHSTLGAFFFYLHPAGKGQLLYEKQIEASPSIRIEHKYYISAGGVSVAVHYARENPNVTETATRHLQLTKETKKRTKRTKGTITKGSGVKFFPRPIHIILIKTNTYI